VFIIPGNRNEIGLVEFAQLADFCNQNLLLLKTPASRRRDEHDIDIAIVTRDNMFDLLDLLQSVVFPSSIDVRRDLSAFRLGNY
jgi:hypothetical protein